MEEGVGLNTGSKEGRGVSGGGGRSVAVLPPHATWTCYKLTGRLLFCSRESRQGGRGSPVHVRPAATVWVHKGIWRAWWRPPCYSTQEQRGASRASSPTWQMRRIKSLGMDPQSSSFTPAALIPTHIRLRKSCKQISVWEENNNPAEVRHPVHFQVTPGLKTKGPGAESF